MQERLKEIREFFHMTQAEFSKKLGIGQSTLAMMEVSKRDISDRHIKTICAICNVNEEWLRTGEGEMFNENDESIISEVATQYRLSELDKEILKIFLELSPEKREAFKDFAFSLVDSVLSNSTLSSAYHNHVNENALLHTSPNGDTPSLDESAETFDEAGEGIKDSSGEETVRVFRAAKSKTNKDAQYVDIPRSTIEKLKAAKDVDEI